MLIGECRVILEYAALRLALPWLRRSAPRGTGQPVLVVPGFATDDRWTSTLCAFLRDIGYRAHGWGLGRNHGNVGKLIPHVIERVAELSTAHGTPIGLVGWSLGGYLAREVARERTDLVDRVVTLGAPVIGGPKYTASARYYRRKGYDVDAIEQHVEERDAKPIETPVVALYSRSDGVVAWRACIDDKSPRVEHHEVFSSHLGLIFSPVVYRRVAALLAGLQVPKTR